MIKQKIFLKVLCDFDSKAVYIGERVKMKVR